MSSASKKSSSKKRKLSSGANVEQTENKQTKTKAKDAEKDASTDVRAAVVAGVRGVQSHIRRSAAASGGASVCMVDETGGGGGGAGAGGVEPPALARSLSTGTPPCTQPRERSTESLELSQKERLSSLDSEITDTMKVVIRESKHLEKLVSEYRKAVAPMRLKLILDLPDTASAWLLENKNQIIVRGKHDRTSGYVRIGDYAVTYGPDLLTLKLNKTTVDVHAWKKRYDGANDHEQRKNTQANWRKFLYAAMNDRDERDKLNEHITKKERRDPIDFARIGPYSEIEWRDIVESEKLSDSMFTLMLSRNRRLHYTLLMRCLYKYIASYTDHLVFWTNTDEKPAHRWPALYEETELTNRCLVDHTRYHTSSVAERLVYEDDHADCPQGDNCLEHSAVFVSDDDDD